MKKLLAVLVLGVSIGFTSCSSDSIEQETTPPPTDELLRKELLPNQNFLDNSNENNKIHVYGNEASTNVYFKMYRQADQPNQPRLIMCEFRDAIGRIELWYVYRDSVNCVISQYIDNTFPFDDNSKRIRWWFVANNNSLGAPRTKTLVVHATWDGTFNNPFIPNGTRYWEN